jgi:hypothetical protein
MSNFTQDVERGSSAGFPGLCKSGRFARFCRMSEGAMGSRLVELQEVRPIALGATKGGPDLQMILVQEITPRRDRGPGDVTGSRFALD